MFVSKIDDRFAKILFVIETFAIITYHSSLQWLKMMTDAIHLLYSTT